MKKLVLFVLLVVAAQTMTAQSFYFRRYQVENGLSNSSVLSCIQDERGFMWFGTKDGLNRFDGYTFKTYRNDPADKTSLGSNFVNVLYEDPNHQLWVGTDKGIYHYEARTESFHVLKGAATGEIRSILKDHQGNLWYIADQHLYKLNSGSHVLQSYHFENTLITSLTITPKGQIWVSSGSGVLYRYNPVKDTFRGLNLFTHSPVAASWWIEKIYAINDDQIFAGTSNQGLKLFNIQSNSYTDLLTNNADHTPIFVRDIMPDKNNQYWIATESGIYIYNLLTRSFINLNKQYNDPYSLSDNAIYCLFKDKDADIWAGTYFGGINYYSVQNTLFKKYTPAYLKNSLSGNAVRKICQDAYGDLWIGTEDAGLNRFQPKTGVFTSFKPTAEKKSISYTNIHGLLVNGNELWIGTFEHGLDVMDIRSLKIIRHYTASGARNALKSNFILAIYKTRAGDILIGTGAGLFKYHQQTNDFSQINALHTQTILEDTHGAIWTGTYRSGIYVYTAQLQLLGSYKNEAENKSSLSNNTVNGIFEDTQHSLWFSTENGLCRLNAKRTGFTRYTVNDGLPSNLIFSMLEDRSKNLWISTSGGLVAMNLLSHQTRVFTKANGLLNNQFNYDSAFQDASGTFYFGSVKGMISFNPAQFIPNTALPSVYITGFQVDNKEVTIRKSKSPLKESVLFSRKIILNHDQSSFSIDFSALSFRAPEMAQYAYQMVGLDNKWSHIKNNRKVYYTDLSPGSYVFKVKASNSSGLWNEQPTVLHIVIEPPFWAGPVAIVIYLLTFIALTYYLFKVYHARHEEKNKRKIEQFLNEKEREIYHAKIEFFTNITHEIRSPLTLIKGPLENILHKPGISPEIKRDLEIIEKNSGRLLDLTNQLLDFRKAEIKGFSLNFVRTNISALIVDVLADFKPMAEEKGIQLQCSFPAKDLFAYADPEALHKILGNLFTNAIKYGKKNVSILLHPDDAENITLEIRNDGYLIPYEMREKIFEPFYRLPQTENEQGKGIGLALSKALAELHNGQLELQQPADGFNIFKLSIPVHQQQEYRLFNEYEEEEITGSTADRTVAELTKPVILLVEDDRDINNFIAEQFSATYLVIKAYNGNEAVRVLKEETVQLVLSDIMMPAMDGFELCRIIKTTFEFSHIPVIMLTAKNSLQSKITALESGADAFIEKPFSLEHLKVQIINLLKSRTNIKEYFASSPLVHMKSMAYSKADENFLEKLNVQIDSHIGNMELDVDQLAEVMNMSRPTLYRKIKAISNLTPNELINIARLKKAAVLLAEGDLKIYEIATLVGFSSQTNLGRNFMKQFGMSPSEYMAAKKKERSKPFKVEDETPVHPDK